MMTFVVHIVNLVAPGLPITIVAEDHKVILNFKTSEEALKYASDIAEGLREFAHLWKAPDPTTRAVVPSYLCPHCGRESWNTDDIKHRYCGACKSYGPG